MKCNKPVIILVGQVYFDDSKNEYLVIRRRAGEMISYAGHGFYGILEDETFFNEFLPVDVSDLSDSEAEALLAFCPAGTTLKTGFIYDEGDV